MRDWKMGVLIALLMLLAPSAFASRNCPSTPKKATTYASCTCPSGLLRGVVTQRFQGKGIRWRGYCALAARKARAACLQRGQVASFQSRYLRHKVTRVGSLLRGYCKISYSCRWYHTKRTFTRRVKQTGNALRLQGSHFASKSSGNRSKAAVCALTTLRARRHLSRKYRGLLRSFKVLRSQYRKIKGFGRPRGSCKIWYRATLQRASWSVKRFFFCSRR